MEDISGQEKKKFKLSGQEYERLKTAIVHFVREFENQGKIK
jgi:hypothetical protein